MKTLRALHRHHHQVIGRTLAPFVLALILPLASLQAQDSPKPLSSANERFEKAKFEGETAGNALLAIELYQGLIEEKALPAKQLESAYLRLSRLLRELGRHDSSKKVAQEFLAAFPNSRHAQETHRQLEEQVGTDELFRRVSLLGLWQRTPAHTEPASDPDTTTPPSSDSSIDYLELLPGGRYHVFPHPLDTPDLEAPAAPTESGSYHINQDRIELRSGAQAVRYAWQIQGQQLRLETMKDDKPSRAVTRTRARRPFRFPREVSHPPQLTALLNLKAAEARAVCGYLEDVSHDMDGARDVLTSSEMVDGKLRELAQGTTAEFLVETGLDLITLAADLLESNRGSEAGEVLELLEEIRWNHSYDSDDLQAAVGSYGLQENDIAGHWRGHFLDEEDALSLKLRKDGTFEFPPGFTTGFFGEPFTDPRYMIDRSRLAFIDEGQSHEWLPFQINREALHLYDGDDGWAYGFFQREDGPLGDSGLWTFAHGHHTILDAITPLASHATIRDRLFRYHHHLATIAEGTTAGLLARAALRQLAQLDQAYELGDQARAYALQSAFQPTQSLLVTSSLRRVLDRDGMILPKESRPSTPPYPCAYDGAFELNPAEEALSGQRSPDLHQSTSQAHQLKERILSEGLLQQVFVSASPAMQQSYLASFGNLASNDVLRLLERYLTLQVDHHEDPLLIRVRAFPHHDPTVAAYFGNQLAQRLANLPGKPAGSHWAWRLHKAASDSALPIRQFLPESPPVPATLQAGDHPRGRHPRELYNRFVYELLIKPFDNGRRSVMTENTFHLVQSGARHFALRSEGAPSWNELPEKVPLTLVTLDDQGKAKETLLVHATHSSHSKLELQHEDCILSIGQMGNLSSWHSMMNQRPSSGPAIAVSPRHKKALSVARTRWSDPKDIRLDDPTLRWYTLQP